MEPRRPKRRCQCSLSSVSFSSGIPFLSIIPPSFAQLPTSTPTPTTLSTSIKPVFSFASTTLPASRTQVPVAPASTTATVSSEGINTHVFNYYFLIVAVFAVLFCIAVLYFARRKKRKAAFIRTSGQRALARDVEGWRTRLGVGRNGIPGSGTLGRTGREEAPPPYSGDKPPSFRAVEENSGEAGIELGGREAVELRMMVTNGLPEYHEVIGSEENSAGITRPITAITASESFGSMRRLMSNTGSSSQA